ncbi:MAG TPA: 7-carboxy-7-deazaguanine synthase QueE [Myxococcota bacterium]
MPSPVHACDAILVEIFSSIQGEGTHVGTTTLFVRFGGCDLRCRWCDSPQTWKPASECRIEVDRGSGRFEIRSNPVSVADAIAAAESLDLAAHEFVSLTGGEPLLQPEAVSAIARAMRAVGPRILLETHGLAVDALSSVLSEIDVVSMDWKLISDVRRASDPRHGAVEPFHTEHEKFLALARRAPELIVKLVITPTSADAEIDDAVSRIEASAPDATLILQPVTPFGAVREAPSAERMLALCMRISSRLAKVRVIPQTHKIYGAL